MLQSQNFILEPDCLTTGINDMLKRVIEHLSGAKTPEGKNSTPEEKIHFNRKSNALQGDLSVVTIENLMQLMSHSGLSGELHLVAPHNAAYFIVDNGTLVFGYIKSNSSKIGERLAEKEYITSENLKECLQLYRNQTTKSKFGTLLIEKGFLSKSELEETIKEQVRDIFFEVLSWKEGSFSFCACKCTASEDILLEERIDHLILTGIIQMDNQAQGHNSSCTP